MATHSLFSLLILLFLTVLNPSHVAAARLPYSNLRFSNRDSTDSYYTCIAAKRETAALKSSKLGAIKESQIFKQKERSHDFSPEVCAKVISRFPKACVSSFDSGMKAFLQSAIAMIPLAMMWDIKKIRQPKVWVASALKTGVEWAKYSGLYMGGDEFFAKMRNRDDRYNSYFGSALTSAVLRIEEGPLSMIQGFVVGYGFMFALDQVMLSMPQPEEGASIPAQSRR